MSTPHPWETVPTPRKDDLDWLTAAVREHRGKLSDIARREGLTAEEAVECVQDALCTLVARPPPEALDPHQLIAYLRAMVRNAARNQRRLHRLRKPHSVEAAAQLVASHPDAVELLVQAESLLRLRSCVAELCGVQRGVVTLRLLEEQNGEDVAQILGVSRGYVDVLVHRAKAALRVCMERPAGVTAGQG